MNLLEGEADDEVRRDRDMSGAEWLGSAGVALLLVAFVLNLAGRIERDARTYHALNLVGAGLAAIASWWIGFVPFVVLEVVWAGVALVAFVRRPQSA